MSIDSILLKTLENKFSQKGDTFRLRHEFKMNGDICTDRNKGPALTVTRDTGGWVWCCHRCSESGFIGDKFVNPDMTLKRIENIKVEKPKEEYMVKLPDDYNSMIRDKSHVIKKEIPFEAYSWLWKYGITEQDMLDYGFGWSDKHKMVILPLPSTDNRVLNGWIGRNVMDSDQKYHIQKPKGADRLYFSPACVDTESGNYNEKIILVEDCLSAIKVHKATGTKVIALLTTSVDEDLTLKLKKDDVYIWLDADALAKSVAMVTRFRQLGIKAKHIYTAKDPKCYNVVAINEIWKESIKCQ